LIGTPDVASEVAGHTDRETLTPGSARDKRIASAAASTIKTDLRGSRSPTTG